MLSLHKGEAIQFSCIYLVIMQPRKVNGPIPVCIAWTIGAVVFLEYLIYMRHFVYIISFNHQCNLFKLG